MAAVRATIQANSLTIVEGNEETLCIELITSVEIAGNITVLVTSIDNTAHAEFDFEPLSNLLTFPPGSKNHDKLCLKIYTVEDFVLERTENFEAVLTAVTRNVIIQRSKITVTIISEDTG